MYDLAIIGGMGPEATAETFRRIVNYTYATKDQEHIKLVIFNDTGIPDRTNFILNESESPLSSILVNIENAKLIGCRNFIIPCNTSHVFGEIYSKVDGINFISMIDCVLKFIASMNCKAEVCILGTVGTIEADIYRKSEYSNGISIVYPNKCAQDIIMECIREIKRGSYDISYVAKKVEMCIKDEFDLDNTLFVLACTELSMLSGYLNVQTLDALDTLVLNAINICGYTTNSNIEIKV